VLSSPVFSKSFYSSADATQFADAIQRAEFINKADEDWHTVLKSRVETTRTWRSYAVRTGSRSRLTGTCCAFVLIDLGTFINALFPATASDTTTPIGAAENAGESNP